ncbi:hypothetical protein [Halococcus sp. PRR34]|uniref:hypothetical protein n=1 Tax=Halococcus sp. PRR34 TaxID=3020830 RepID=UPI00235F8337|nr:hypothetical protein [Halococcus sp. PRR34]
MLGNIARHPLQTLNRLRTTLVHRTITANLEQAHEHAINGNYEGFERHCGHAERLAERHAPDRVDDVDRVVAAAPDQLDEPIESNHPQIAERTANV